MGSLFSRRNLQSNNFQNPQDNNQVNPSALDYAQNMLRRSGGDAKAAFYLAAQEKGIDADQFLKQLASMGDMKSVAQNMLMSNPRAKQFMSLFSMMK